MTRARPRLLRAFLMFVVAAPALVACSPVESKGTMPPPGANGQVDPSAAPNFIAVAGRDGGIAGYVRKEAVLLAAGRAAVDRAWPVYAEDLRTVVGQLVPGKGFVPADVDPATVPTFPVVVAPSGDVTAEPTGRLTVYFRNGAADEGWIAFLDGGRFQHGTGFWGHGYVGVGCYPVPTTGARLVLLDRAPQQPGATVIKGISMPGSAAKPLVLWIDVASDGQVSEGNGVPTWWSGGAQAC